MKDSIYLARFIVLVIWWFFTMCLVFVVALSGEGREDLEEEFEKWRDRNTKLLISDEIAESKKIFHFTNDTVGGILK